MMRNPLLAAALLVGSAQARAADTDLGVGASLAVDLPDPTSAGTTRFGPGPGLLVPVRFGVASHARLRTTLRADMGLGNDQVTWAIEVDANEVRLGSNAHWSMVTAAALTAGPEVLIPVEGGAQPYLGVEAGGAWVATWHSFQGPSAVVIDPARNDLDNQFNIDPYTSQLTFLTDAHLGLDLGGEGLGFWTELGYSMAFVGAAPLKKSTPGLDARREAYGWNPLRLGAGLRLPL